jgi:hypothetical protein
MANEDRFPVPVPVVSPGCPPVHPPDDSSLRSLFTHPRMVQDLCLGFVREPWAGKLDFSTLEPLSPAGLATARDAGGAEGAELVWRLRFQGGRTWIHLVLALAPEVDRALPLRLAGGIAALLLDLHRQGRLARSGRLPGVVPFVLYYGEPLWSVPRQLADLFEPVPHGLERALPRLSPFVLDLRREPIPERLTGPEDPGNLAALLFALERSRTAADLDGGIARLAELLPGPLPGALADLRRDFGRYVRDWLLPHRFAGIGFETVAAWAQPLREQARRQGAAELLGRLLDHRFGPLDATDRGRLAGAPLERLHAWGERALSAPTLDEVFD